MSIYVDFISDLLMYYFIVYIAYLPIWKVINLSII